MIKKLLGHAATFVIVYILFMIPTYVLPWIGSNSTLVNSAGVASNAGMNPAFWVHLICLLVLVGMTWIRGSLINKNWIVVFPILAACFDLLPGLSLVPFVPTIMHLLAIIMGVSAKQSETQIA